MPQEPRSGTSFLLLSAKQKAFTKIEENKLQQTFSTIFLDLLFTLMRN